MTRTEEMRRFFRRCEKSGQSIRAFSMSEGVSYSTAMYWRSKLRRDSRPDEETDLVPVTIVDSPRELSTDFAVRLPNEMTVMLPPHFDTAELQRLVAVLRSC